MEKNKEGKPGEARASLRRSVREIGYALAVSLQHSLLLFPACTFQISVFKFLNVQL